jgi:hypothetical protein
LLEGEKYVTVSWIPTALKGILSKLESIINAPVDPHQADTPSKLAVRNLAAKVSEETSRWIQ